MRDDRRRGVHHEYEKDAYAPLVSVQKTLEVMKRWGKC